MICRICVSRLAKYLERVNLIPQGHSKTEFKLGFNYKQSFLKRLSYLDPKLLYILSVATNSKESATLRQNCVTVLKRIGCTQIVELVNILILMSCYLFTTYLLQIYVSTFRNSSPKFQFKAGRYFFSNVMNDNIQPTN